MVGWVVVGLLTSVTGELILPGRNPAGSQVQRFATLLTTQLRNVCRNAWETVVL
jgi:hypothetical protein